MEDTQKLNRLLHSSLFVCCVVRLGAPFLRYFSVLRGPWLVQLRNGGAAMMHWRI